MKEKVTLAGGCFWCTEAVFKRLKGVTSAQSGYAGGHMNNPSYEAVSAGNTGHAEAIQITFDPEIISLEKLLEVFFKLHDPTTLNKQGNDVGEQYRSVIFYDSSVQKKTAEDSIKKARKLYKDPIVTEIVPLSNFYKAEDYHQDYYEKNRSAAYCQVIIDPKITKLFREFPKIVKGEK